MKEASFYEKKNGKVRCLLCPHYCVIDEGQRGLCGVREHRDGTLFATTYCMVAAVAVDPVEKKPLYHFYPGMDILSVGATGCNFNCPFCQNWHLVEGSASLKKIEMEELVRLAETSRSVGISYTYNEPLIQWEFVYDCARLFHKKNLKNIIVTNGYVNVEPLMELLPYLDGMNVDLKFFRDEKYRKVSRGSLEPVKRTIEIAANNCHVEVTTLLVTGLNDGEEEVRDIVDFLYSVNPEIPFHISRYFPSYRYTAPPTEPKVLMNAYETAKTKLHHVYLGNIQVPGAADTTCPKCGIRLVKRSGHTTEIHALEGRICGNCGKEQNFVN